MNNKRHTVEWPEERCLVEIDQGGQTHRSRVSTQREKCFSMTYLTPTPLDVKLQTISTFLHSTIDTSRCLEWSPTPATFHVNDAAHELSTRHSQNFIGLDNTVENDHVLVLGLLDMQDAVRESFSPMPGLVRPSRRYLAEPAIYHVR